MQIDVLVFAECPNAQAAIELVQRVVVQERAQARGVVVGLRRAHAELLEGAEDDGHVADDERLRRERALARP